MCICVCDSYFSLCTQDSCGQPALVLQAIRLHLCLIKNIVCICVCDSYFSLCTQDSCGQPALVLQAIRLHLCLIKNIVCICVCDSYFSLCTQDSCGQPALVLQAIRLHLCLIKNIVFVCHRNQSVCSPSFLHYKSVGGGMRTKRDQWSVVIMWHWQWKERGKTERKNSKRIDWNVKVLQSISVFCFCFHFVQLWKC